MTAEGRVRCLDAPNCKPGRFEAVARMYGDWLAGEPGHPKAADQLAPCAGKGVPPRASDEHVRQVFDLVADSLAARPCSLPTVCYASTWSHLGG